MQTLQQQYEDRRNLMMEAILQAIDEFEKDTGFEIGNLQYAVVETKEGGGLAVPKKKKHLSMKVTNT